MLYGEISVRRSVNFYTHYDTNKEITSVEKNINFKTVQSNFTNENRVNINENLGVVDLDTFNMDGKSLCYSIGFYTENSQCKIYYINEDLNTVDIIQDCIFELLKSKYDPYTLYCHNFGRCDAPFILKALIEFNKTCENKDKYYFDILTRYITIIRLKVKRRIDGKVRSVRIHDSLPILSNSLRDLCTYYKIDEYFMI